MLTEAINIPGAAGNLELVITKPAEEKYKTVAIICHPHPLYGGTMNNKVVTTLARAFNSVGLSSIRFNFRGVGQSEGEYTGGKGETADVITIAQWASQHFPGYDLWLAGFSFGSYVACLATAQLPQTKRLITIAPPVRGFTFDHWPAISCPWLVVQGEKDEVISPDAVYAWAEHFNPQPQLVKIADASHFFHGKLGELRRIVEAFSTT